MALVDEHPVVERPVPAGPSVHVIRWPDEEPTRAHLAAHGRPRLLVLEPATPPPLVWDALEDWVRSPADPVEVDTRIRTLEHRARTTEAVPARPTLDADGIVRWDGAWVAVPPVEARLLTLLLRAMGEAVPRAELVAAGWPTGEASARALDGRVKLLRRRLSPLGLQVSTVRGVGFLLEEPGRLPG